MGFDWLSQINQFKTKQSPLLAWRSKQKSPWKIAREMGRKARKSTKDTMKQNKVFAAPPKKKKRVSSRVLPHSTPDEPLFLKGTYYIIAYSHRSLNEIKGLIRG